MISLALFRRTKEVKVANAVVVKTKAVPVGKLSVATWPLPDEDYMELAQELGAVPSNLEAKRLYNQFVTWLNSRGLVVYNRDEVDNFLRQECPKDKEVVWVPLLKKDSAPIYPSWHSVGKVEPIGTQYKKDVPHAVLLLVKSVLADFPEAKFYVSDYAVPVPDPFLGVSLPGNKMIVIEHWDKPTFGLKK